MRRVALTVRLPTDLHERIVAHKDAVGIPVNEFIVRATAAALDDGAPARNRKPARRPKPSAN